MSGDASPLKFHPAVIKSSTLLLTTLGAAVKPAPPEKVNVGVEGTGGLWYNHNDLIKLSIWHWL